MPVQRLPWLFYDPTTARTYTFPINPSSIRMPELSKSARTDLVMLSGHLIRVEEPDERQTLEIEGQLLTANNVRELREFALIENVVRLTDDLDRSWWGYVMEFELTRTKGASHPERRKYRLRMTLIDELDVLAAAPQFQFGYL